MVRERGDTERRNDIERNIERQIEDKRSRERGDIIHREIGTHKKR